MLDTGTTARRETSVVCAMDAGSEVSIWWA